MKSRLDANLYAVPLLLVALAAGCGPEAEPLSPDSPAATGTGVPCLLFVNTECAPGDAIEVLVDGNSIGKFPSARSGDEPRIRRAVFRAAGQVRFTFPILRGDRLLYQPEMDAEVSPGDMLSCQFLPSDEKPQFDFGPPPDRSFPAIGPDVPKSVWCWFGPANARTDCFRVRLEGTVVPSVKERAAAAGYTVLREWPSGELQLGMPEGRSIVDAMLKVERWDGVREVFTEPAAVY